MVHNEFGVTGWTVWIIKQTKHTTEKFIQIDDQRGFEFKG